MTQRAEAAQHRRHQRPRERAVALGKAGKARMRGRTLQLFIERAAAAQHAIEDVGSDAPDRQARHRVGAAARPGSRCSRGFHAAFLARFAGTGERLAAGQTFRHVKAMRVSEPSSPHAENEATPDQTTQARKLPPAAKRALAEAAARRARQSGDKADKPKEVGGPGGPEPTRYGDWERLRDIDAPELQARCADERVKAEVARAALATILAEGDLAISRVGLDKYGGRVDAAASTRNTPNVSAAMRDGGWARSYDGGRRGSWC